jgi:hypothetical protein
VAESSSPWLRGGKEIAFTTPLLGHGGISPMLLAHVAIQRPPFDDSFTFVVARTNSCLNLRAGPSAASASEGCLPDGATVTRQPVALPEYAQPVGASVEADGRWVHVVSADGRAGWVSAAYLDWATP